MDRRVVQDDDVAGREVGREHLADTGDERIAIDRAVQRSDMPVQRGPAARVLLPSGADAIRIPTSRVDRIEHYEQALFGASRLIVRFDWGFQGCGIFDAAVRSRTRAPTSSHER